MTINIKEAQHPLKREKQVIDKSSIMLKISTKSMHRVLVFESLKAMEKNAEYGGQPEILALVHVIERPITVHYEDSDKGTVCREFFY